MKQRTPNLIRALMWSTYARRGLFAAAAFTIASHCQAQVTPQVCGSLDNGYGPFEYRNDRFKLAPGDQQPYHQKLRLTEDFHFTPAVEALIRGVASATPHLDLDYTLRVFPNHHRALAALIRLWERSKSPRPGDLPRPVECYFERATRFQPDDTTVRLLYATFLRKADRKQDALRELDVAVQHAGDNAFTHYNAGLVFLDIGEHELALSQAHRALELGFTRMELRNRLVEQGRWREPSSASDPAKVAP